MKNFHKNSFTRTLAKTHSLPSNVRHVLCGALLSRECAAFPVCIGGGALSCLCLTLFVRIIINIVMLLIALSETTAATKITALTTVAFTVCHYINYHNGYDRLCLRIHTSAWFVILNSKGKLEIISISTSSCFHVPPSFSEKTKTKTRKLFLFYRFFKLFNLI